MQTQIAQNYQAVIDSPIGGVGITVNEKTVVGIEFLHKEIATPVFHSQFAEQVAEELARYFSNAAYEFQSEISPKGTEHQISVWHQLQKIPAGERKTYGQLADHIGSGARAIGNACRNNPIPIIIPCHRVVAKNGLGGFAGQTTGFTLDVKRWLLNHESTAVC